MTPPRVGILLSTFDGARFLSAQLESFSGQTERDWVLFWRDDGSTDDTVHLLEAFAAKLDRPRCVRVGASGHLGASGSFFALLREGASWDLPLAFADQDDVWLPDKLAWALDALAGQTGPVLYCSRQMLVDGALAPLGESAPLPAPPAFPAALTQNIATGCTVALNPAAARLVAASRPPPGSLHDWWSYLMVTAAGGRVIVDPRPTVLYRQHGGNLVGAPRSVFRRARGALQRGPGAYITTLREHVAALRAQPELLTEDARRTVDIIANALDGGFAARCRALRLPNLSRQTRLETALFRWWFLTG